MYLEDSDGYFPPGIDFYVPDDPVYPTADATGVKGPGSSKGEWIWALQPYYKLGKDPKSLEKGIDIFRCPTATKRLSAGGSDATFLAWEGNNKEGEARFEDHRYVGKGKLYGSYGINRMIYNVSDAMVKHWSLTTKTFWRSNKVNGANSIPLLADSLQMGCSWFYGCDPPKVTGVRPEFWNTSNMSEASAGMCLNRHGSNKDGKTNMLFLDFTVRSVGLKELWILHWTGTWKEDSRDIAMPDWANDAPWMASFKDYVK